MLEETCNVINTLTGGLGAVFAYDNIAIVVLALCLLGAGFIIMKGLKMFHSFAFSIKDVLAEVNKSIAILNERLDHHKDGE